MRLLWICRCKTPSCATCSVSVSLCRLNEHSPSCEWTSGTRRELGINYMTMCVSQTDTCVWETFDVYVEGGFNTPMYDVASVSWNFQGDERFWGLFSMFHTGLQTASERKWLIFLPISLFRFYERSILAVFSQSIYAWKMRHSNHNFWWIFSPPLW